MKNRIGILQGRLTASNGRGVQFFPFEAWEEEFAVAKKVGFGAIELLVKKDSYQKNPLWSERGRKRLRELAKEHGLLISSVHGFTLKTPEYAEVAADLVRFSREVGANTILLSFFDENMLKNKEDKESARERLGPAVKLAEGLGVRLGIEAEMSAPELLEFIDSFNSDVVGVYYDIGNMVSMNVDVPVEIALLGDRIFGIHIKDRLKNGGPSVPIGSGDSNFPAVLNKLKEIGYEGVYILQGAREENTDDIELNQKYFNFLSDLI